MNKKGVSIMIGYVLLIAGIIVISGIVYLWMRSYVPRPTPECPDGVSLFVKEVTCESEGSEYKVNLSISNNGRFDVDGYFIKATKNPEQKIATFDISKNIIFGGKTQPGTGIVLFFGGVLVPGNETKAVYNLSTEEEEYPDGIFSIEITPIRYEVIEGKISLISCGNAKVKEKVTC